MSLTKPTGKLTWTASPSTDVVSYNVYQQTGGDPTYESPSANVGLVTEAVLPIAGLPAVEGEVRFAVGAVDSVGHISDLTAPVTVLIDTVPPPPASDLEFSRDF